MSRHIVGRADDTPVALGDEPRIGLDLLRDAAAIARILPDPWPGSEVVLICRDRYCGAAGMLGAWVRGHAVALPPNGRPESVAALAARAESAGVLQDGEGFGIDVRDALGAGGPPAPPFECAGDRRLLTLYTSGSTGQPLPCPKTADQILGEAEQLAAFFALGPGRRLLPTVPPHHIYGLLFGVLAPLHAGAAFARGTPLHAETIEADARRLGIDVLVSAPAHLRGLAVLDPGALPRFARVFTSGAPVPASTATMLRERFGMEVTEILGSSETGGFAWRTAGTTAWTPMPAVRVLAGGDGLLHLDSPFLAPGAPRPLACPDRIELLPDGRFEHLGRADGVVKIAGERVSALEVEQRLLGLPGVRDAAVRAVATDGPRQHELWAAVVAPEWTAPRLRSALGAWFDPLVLPRRLRLVAALPREETGKVTQERFRALFDASPGLELVPVPPGEDDAARVRRFDIDVPHDLEYFDGHFPDLPLLPGVVQLERLVHRAVRLAWPDLGAPRGVLTLKFKKPVRPGDRVRLTVERMAEARTKFELRSGEAVCSTGVIAWGPPSP